MSPVKVFGAIPNYKRKQTKDVSLGS
ncbi:hypothetical protein CCACVL1_01117, partial [Corchorus capsularis]